jgi:hypothetical protein
MKKPVSPRRRSLDLNAWDAQWQDHWSKVGLAGGQSKHEPQYAV